MVYSLNDVKGELSDTIVSVFGMCGRNYVEQITVLRCRERVVL